MKKKLLLGVIIIVLVFIVWWGFGQWKLLNALIRDEGDELKNYYTKQLAYLETLEQISADVLLSKAPLKFHSDKFKWLKEQDYFLYVVPNIDRYGLVGKRVHYRNLRDFIHITSNFFYNLKAQAEINPEILAYAQKVHDKAKELLAINKQYRYQLEWIDGKEFFYSNIWAEAINKMDESFAESPYKSFAYPKIEEHRHTRHEHPVEEVYGTKVYSEEEASKIAQKFLGDLGTITKITGRGGRSYDDKVILEHVGFETDGGYEIDIYTRGGKVSRLWDQNWTIDRPKKPYKKPEINITRDEAISKLIDFLEERGLGPLEMITTRTSDRYLTVVLAKVEDGYINGVRDISATLDLTRKGRILELNLDSYWDGKAYDDSGKEKALAGYERARAALKSGIIVKDEKLVGRWGQDYSLDFNWRFTTELGGEDYYIYINPETGEETGIVKVHK